MLHYQIIFSVMTVAVFANPQLQISRQLLKVLVQQSSKQSTDDPNDDFGNKMFTGFVGKMFGKFCVQKCEQEGATFNNQKT